jgi:TonB-dependent receptor-like protein/carboxypeptidase family protein
MVPAAQRSTVLATVASLVAGAPPAAQGQSVRGRLLEAETVTPIAQGFVALLTETGQPVSATLTDQTAAFSLAAPISGHYVLQARRVGYRPQTSGPFELKRGLPLALDLYLTAIPQPLEPVTVTAERRVRFLERVGFYDRQRSDFGRFITRDRIEKVHRSRLTDVLTAVPGVRLVPLGTGTGRVAVRMRGSDLPGEGLCEPRVLVDGIVVIEGDAKPARRPPGVTPEGVLDDPDAEQPPSTRQDVDQLVDANDIEAIEVYRSSVETPAAFGGGGMFARCGVIVVWSRRGGARTR